VAPVSGSECTRLAFALLLASEVLSLPLVARADLPRPGIYRVTAPGASATAALPAPFFRSGTVERVVVAVDPTADTNKVKVLPIREGPPAAAEMALGPSTTDGDRPCAAFGADGDPEDGICAATVGTDRAAVSLLDTTGGGWRVSGFLLSEERPYVDIVRLPRRAYFYERPEASKKTAAYVVTGDYVAVLRKDPDWFLVDFSGPRRQTRGWLRREDLVHGLWIAQKHAGPQFTVSAACEAQGGAVDLRAIEVKERASGRRIQTIYLDGMGPPVRGTCDDVIAVTDVNFDGYPDLVFRAAEGMVNFTDAFYVFNPAHRTFVYDEELSSLSQPVIDSAKREIRAAWRNGAAEHGSERYRFEGSRLTLIERIVERCGVERDDECVVTTRRLDHGVYVETTTTRREP
jgi:hypothetical protein